MRPTNSRIFLRRARPFGSSRWLVLAAVLVMGVAGASSAPAEFDIELDLEARVACQRAIEEIYWQHRIWPEANPGSKPAFSSLATDAVLRTKVEDGLLKSAALGSFWDRPLSSAEIRTEIEHMARNTRSPERLREIWGALGNDPIRIGECLARPQLADRLVRSRYAFDSRFHGELAERVAAELEEYGSAKWMRLLGGDYSEVTWVREATEEIETPGRPTAADEHRLSPSEWDEAVARLGDALGSKSASPGSLPLLEMSPLREEADRFYVTALLDAAPDRLRVATVEWKKRRFEQWWQEARNELPLDLSVVDSEASLPEIAATCADDTWSPMRDLPNARALHLAVWTGSEMLIWGNRDVFGASEAGGRYDPATDVWQPITTVDHPQGNMVSTGIWTGSEFVVWGGFEGTGSAVPVATGARYEPISDSWTATNTSGSPTPRGEHIAVWTGGEMLVWGGCGDTTNCSSYLDSGGRYDPVADAWSPPMSTLDAPSPRQHHTGSWTGSELVVWAGEGPGVFNILNDGARYDPTTDSWSPMSDVDAPVARVFHTAVATDSEVVVFGGCSTQNCITQLTAGARYDPATDAWSPTSTIDEPSKRYTHTALWTGSEMIVHGGCVDDECSFQTATGGRYDPPTDSWTPTSTTGAPSRAAHTVVWTGTEMIVWGGCSTGECQTELSSGARYNPATNSWIATSLETGPVARINHSAVWTGAEMILWGGAGASNDGALYDPATDHWTKVNPIGGRGRDRPTAVWTGTEMLVWGGSQAGVGASNSGERYDVVSDSWQAMSLIAAPAARMNQSGVWTGTEMIVWSGCPGSVCSTPYLKSGGRYNPATDSWTPTSLSGAPAGRISTSSATESLAVWTGTEMVVWGGWPANGDQTNTGGRYSPATDSWLPTPFAGAPSARRHHTVSWTGAEVLVWGGEDATGSLDDGARYAPSTNSWAPMSSVSAPSARHRHTAVWSGSEMVVWGGTDDPFVNELDTGGRYDPAMDTWSATSSGPFLPFERALHTAVWTGEQMLIWGGLWNGSGQTDTGAAYCAVGGGLTCQELDRFQARCTAQGRLQVRVILVDSSHDGESITIDIDGQPFELPIINGRASFSLPNQGGTGLRTVEVVESPGCFPPRMVTCN